MPTPPSLVFSGLEFGGSKLLGLWEEFEHDGSSPMAFYHTGCWSTFWIPGISRHFHKFCGEGLINQKMSKCGKTGTSIKIINKSAQYSTISYQYQSLCNFTWSFALWSGSSCFKIQTCDCFNGVSWFPWYKWFFVSGIYYQLGDYIISPTTISMEPETATVDGRNPAPSGMYKTLVKNGSLSTNLNCLAGFLNHQQLLIGVHQLLHQLNPSFWPHIRLPEQKLPAEVRNLTPVSNRFRWRKFEARGF